MICNHTKQNKRKQKKPHSTTNQHKFWCAWNKLENSDLIHKSRSQSKIGMEKSVKIDSNCVSWVKQKRAPVVTASCYGVNHCRAGGKDNTGLDRCCAGQQCMSLCVIWVSRQWECILWSAGMWLGHLRAAVIWLSARQKAGSGVSWVGGGVGSAFKSSLKN